MADVKRKIFHRWSDHFSGADLKMLRGEVLAWLAAFPSQMSNSVILLYVNHQSLSPSFGLEPGALRCFR
jgi:hypothetical protein